MITRGDQHWRPCIDRRGRCRSEVSLGAQGKGAEMRIRCSFVINENPRFLREDEAFLRTLLGAGVPRCDVVAQVTARSGAAGRSLAARFGVCAIELPLGPDQAFCNKINQLLTLAHEQFDVLENIRTFLGVRECPAPIAPGCAPLGKNVRPELQRRNDADTEAVPEAAGRGVAALCGLIGRSSPSARRLGEPHRPRELGVRDAAIAAAVRGAPDRVRFPHATGEENPRRGLYAACGAA